MSRQAVSKWERDEAMPEAEKLVRISDCFAVTIDSLLRPDREPEAPTPPGRRAQALPELEEIWRKYGRVLAWALAAWGRLALAVWRTRSGMDAAVSQQELGVGVLWLYGAVLAAGLLLLCWRRPAKRA